MVQLEPDHSAAPTVAPTAGARLAAASALDAQIRALHERRNQDEARLAELLVEMARSRGYLALGFSSLEAYAYERLGWGWAKVRDMLKLMERLPGMPATETEFKEGRLPWTKAVVVARAVEEAPGEEARWLEEAQLKSASELQRALAAERGEPLRRRVMLELAEEDYALIQDGWRALRREGLKLDRGAATAELVRRALVGGGGSSAFRVVLSHDPETGETRQATRDGEVLLAPEHAARVTCDAELQNPSGKVTRAIPTRVRNKVLARSGDKCEIPGCGHRVGLEVHHLRGWRRGHDLDDLLHLCAAHHKAFHEGALRGEGSWKTGLTFRLADGAVLGTRGGKSEAAASSVARPAEASGKVGEGGGEGGAADRLSRSEGKRAEPKARAGSRAAARSERPPKAATPARDQQTRASEEELICRALAKLKLPRREAKARIRWVRAHRPELRGVDAIVRAALTVEAAQRR